MGIYDVPGIDNILKVLIMEKDILYPLRRLHGCIYEARKLKESAKHLKKQLLKVDKNTAFFVLSPTHGNMGDHAIAEAVVKMLCELGINYFEVTTAQLSLLNRFGYLNVLDKHLILVNGGGNLGTLWPDVERLFRNIIQNNLNASIICLPNTIYYEATESGRQELEESKQIYNAHPRLILCARETISFSLMQQIYKNVLLIPDMALSLNHCAVDQKRGGCMLCLRSDREKTLTTTMEREIAEQAKILFSDNVWRSDMNIGSNVSIEERNAALEKKYSEFRSAELVITDRLHGMIFAAITGTPCIVVNSKSPKVKGCYEWVRELNYIRFSDDLNQITALYYSIQKGTHTYSNTAFISLYEQLKQRIYEEMNEVLACQQ